MNDDRQYTQATPRALPAVCAVATLIGAVLWSEAAIVAGLVVVGLWTPVATLLGTAAERAKAAASADGLRSAARAASK